MKKWYSYIILALVCIGFASCQDSDTVPQLQTDGRVSVHLQIALPGGRLGTTRGNGTGLYGWRYG